MSAADELEARAGQIVERSFNAMYLDPFWRARFGERGEKFAREDHAHHVRYLAEAIRSGDSAVLTSYARWVQPVLTSRGMCTKHIDDSLLAVRDAAVAEGIDVHAMNVHIEAARGALRYPGDGAFGNARAVQEAGPRLAEATNRKVSAERTNDVLHLLSYIADAIALGRDEVFANHVRWLAQRTPPGIDSNMLDALADGSTELADETAAAYARIVAKGRSALAGEP